MRRLRRVELVPFRSAVAEGIDGMMAAHISVQGVEGPYAPPASVSRHFVSRVLRDEMGFRGIVFSDAMDMGAVNRRYGRTEPLLMALELATRAYVEMSGRKGLGVKADDMLDELERKAIEAVQKNADDFSAEEAQTIGRQVAVAALRYFMLRFGRNKVIAFDFDEALRFEGDAGPYLQSSTVRVQNIFRKMKELGVDPRIDERAVDDLTLKQGLTDEMWELVRLSAELPAAIRRAVDALEMSVVTQYLLDLAQKFNSFYHKYPILNEKDDAERQRRAVCAEVFRRTMTKTLALLAIPVPSRM
jgi:arginyl-tRNA synthetase